MYNLISEFDNEIFQIIKKEKIRQNNSLELIASENFVSLKVLEAMGSILTNKYAEGYIGKRFYNGCEYIDEIESIAIERARKLFSCEYVNVQPHSGSQANQAVFLALLKPGDTVLGMSLDAGGHLTHGAFANLSGKWFNSVQYSVDPSSYLIDYDYLESIAIKSRPKLIIAGYSAYSRHLDFKKFRQIADKVGAYLMADIAHIAGFVVTGMHENPLTYAHIVTSTTHKTLRGPRGGVVFSNDLDLARKINSALFPGIQGGPLMHIIAAKAVAFLEALQPEYKNYMQQVLINARVLSDVLIECGLDILTGGTDNHMVLVDLRNMKISGKEASNILDSVGITCNKNTVPFDTQSPFITSGIRLGTAACTTRGLKEKEFKEIGFMISEVLKTLTDSNDRESKYLQQTVISKVQSMLLQFPLY